MKQIYTGKVETATFSNPPENSQIEFLWRDKDQLVANEITINFSDPEFLDFIEEWPLEKIEKAAREAAKERAKLKEDYDRKIIENHLKNTSVSCREIIDYINDNNKNTTAVFDFKLIILEQSITLKDKSLKLRIRKAKTILDLLQIYNEIKGVQSS
jgi:hypothetical protein